MRGRVVAAALGALVVTVPVLVSTAPTLASAGVTTSGGSATSTRSASGRAVVATVVAPVVVRVAEAGATVGERLRAYVMAPTALSHTTFQLLDGSNHVVRTGPVGASRGAWSSTYGAVQPVALGVVHHAGVYRVRLVGGSTVESPAMPVGAASTVSAHLTADGTAFFTVQRDGADVVSGPLHRKASHLDDKTAVVYRQPTFTDPDSDELKAALKPLPGKPHRDVEGGWFDAGDYLKFTETASYSLDLTLTALRDRGSDPKLSAETTHGLSWLKRMWDGRTGTLYAQVGVGSGSDDLGILGDHDVWRLPQADDAAHPAAGSQTYFVSHRPVFRANKAGARISPNLAGRVAAAFALAAQVEHQKHPARARADLRRAVAVLSRAKTEQVKDLVSVFPSSYYPESSWSDDLTLGAVEVARAARMLHSGQSSTWLSQAEHWARHTVASKDRDSLNLYDTSALAEAELAHELAVHHISGRGTLRHRVVDDLRHQLLVAVHRADHDRFGSAAVTTDYDSVSHELGLVATAALYRRVTGSHRFDGFATRQLAWVFGANAWGTSFVVGEGATFPQCPQHQVANLSGSLTGGAKVVVGGVVNGPNGTDQFTDLGVPDGARACPVGGGDAFASFDTAGSTYLDDVASWPSVEPADDFTATGVLAYSLR